MSSALLLAATAALTLGMLEGVLFSASWRGLRFVMDALDAAAAAGAGAVVVVVVDGAAVFVGIWKG